MQRQSWNHLHSAEEYFKYENDSSKISDFSGKLDDLTNQSKSLE